MPSVLPLAGRGHTDTPARPTDPGLDTRLRVIRLTPFGRRKGGSRRDPKEAHGARGSLSAPLRAGLAGGSPEEGARRGVETLPRRIAGKLSILPRSIPAFLRPPPARPPASPSQDGDLGSLWQLLLLPGSRSGAAGRSSWSREFESRGGHPRLQSPAETGPRKPPGVNMALEMGWRKGGRGAAFFAGMDGDITEQPRGSLCAPLRFLRAPHRRGSSWGGGTWVWAAAGRGTAQAGGRSGRDTRVPGATHRAGRLHQDSRMPRGTQGSCWGFWHGPLPLGHCKFHSQLSSAGSLSQSALAGNFDLWALPL